jgi:hypothetical protein
MLLFFAGCETTTFSTTADNSVPVVDEPPPDEDNEDGDGEEEERIFITDRTGKKWDVTHAVTNYGFIAEAFQFGLGPFAIKPLMNPEMYSPSDPGYPLPNDARIVGTTINGDTRAYPLRELGFHEVADEKFGDTHVAVAY